MASPNDKPTDNLPSGEPQGDWTREQIDAYYHALALQEEAEREKRFGVGADDLQSWTFIDEEGS